MNSIALVTALTLCTDITCQCVLLFFKLIFFLNVFFFLKPPPPKCQDCRQYLDDSDLKFFQGDPDNAVGGCILKKKNALLFSVLKTFPHSCGQKDCEA